MRKTKLATIEIVKAKDLKIDDFVLWANHEVRVVDIVGDTVYIATWNGHKPTNFCYYYRIVRERVIFT